MQEKLQSFLMKRSRAWLDIDLDAISSNIRILKQWQNPAKIMPIVKANGYGHGLLPVAEACIAGGAEMLGVATIEEGIALRQAGILLPIVLVCPVCPQDAEAVLEYALIASVGDMVLLDALIEQGEFQNKRPNIYLEIDSGMGRSGAYGINEDLLWDKILGANIEVIGISTHFADADNTDTTYTLKQLDHFGLTQFHLESIEFTRFREVSISASHGMLRFGAAGGTVVRPGLLTYGIVPKTELEPPEGLRSALTLKARIATVRELPQGHNVSYGLTHKLRRDSRVATVLIGYADGYPRRLSNVGLMLIHGQYAPVLGRVSMDQTVVDVTEIPEAVAGNEAVCIGTQGDKSITVSDIAQQIGSIEHEVLTAFSPRVHRIYLQSPNSTNAAQ